MEQLHENPLAVITGGSTDWVKATTEQQRRWLRQLLLIYLGPRLSLVFPLLAQRLLVRVVWNESLAIQSC